MGASYSTIPPEDMRNYVRDTGFTQEKVNLLKARFDSLDKDSKGYLSRTDFLAIPELVLNPVGDRIIDVFFQNPEEHHQRSMSSDQSASASDQLSFGNFIRKMVTFRPVSKLPTMGGVNEPNSRRAKLAFAFRMYDLNGDGSISRDEILAVLDMMVGDDVSDEQLNAIAQRAILEVDEDADGELSFEEYVKVMERVDVEQKLSIKFLD